MHFGPWEVAAFGGLWIAAFMLALDVGLRMASNVQGRFPLLKRIQETGWWGFTPLALLTLAGAIFAANAFHVLPDQQKRAEQTSDFQCTALPKPSSLPTSDSSKVFIRLSPEELQELAKHGESAQTRPYIGKWLRISGPMQFFGVSQIGDKRLVLVLLYTHAACVIAALKFSPQWESKLSEKPKHDVISADCKIEAVRWDKLDFEDCELI
jgi:hypothetical protein